MSSSAGSEPIFERARSIIGGSAREQRKDGKNYREFRSDPNDVLGNDHEDFMSYLEQIAFMSVGTYISVKHKVFQVLIKDITTFVSDLIYEFLTEGRFHGNYLIEDKHFANAPEPVKKIYAEMKAELGGFNPNFSKMKADQVAMSFASAIKENMKHQVIEPVMSSNLTNEALGRAKTASVMNA